MYSEFKVMGLSNRTVALTLIDTDHCYGEINMRERIESRDRLSRHIVHVEPGELHPDLFNDFGHSSQVLLRAMLDNLNSKKVDNPRQLAFERFSGISAERMVDALNETGIDSSAYRNALESIARLHDVSDFHKTLLYIILFIVTGCTGDPQTGALETERFASSALNKLFLTPVSQPHDSSPASSSISNLALVRIANGMLKGNNPLYPIDKSGEGTEIGTFAAGVNSITDVETDVSRHHARIFNDDGHWYIEGLSSTNGTTVITGADKREYIVEPPRHKRDANWKSKPFEIFPTDTICLGATTRFMVIPVTS